MRVALLAPLLTCLFVSGASAGPWPRAPGSAFVAASVGFENRQAARAPVTETYAEYGVSGQLVVGAHLRRAEGRLRTDLLARWHPELSDRLALGLTFGARLGGADGRRAAPILAAHLGRGSDTPFGNLWARLDLQAVGSRLGLRGLAEVELSGQVGLRTGWGGLAMVTLSDHRGSDGSTLKLSPALGYAVGRRTTLVLGATVLPRDRRLDGAQVSIWFDN